MPPAKTRPTYDDPKLDAPAARERQMNSTAHTKKSKQTASAHHSAPIQQIGNNVKEVASASADSGNTVNAGQNTGMAWNEASLDVLNTYRVAHNLPVPAAFTSPLHQAILTNSGIGRQSPTMARKRDKRRISKEQLATAVRKHFNGAAVNEIDVVVDLVYKVRNQDKAFRMRSVPGTGFQKK